MVTGNDVKWEAMLLLRCKRMALACVGCTCITDWCLRPKYKLCELASCTETIRWYGPVCTIGGCIKSTRVGDSQSRRHTSLQLMY